MIELKPCPFCNSEAEIETGMSSGFPVVYVSCSNIDCDIMPSISDSILEYATSAWNSRPYENKIKAEAVREWADQAEPNNESEDRMVNDAYDYADKLEENKL